MKLFLDSANLDELRAAIDLGIIDGVTTNPSLIAKEGVALEDQIQRICQEFDGDVSAAVTALTFADMLLEARRLARIHRNVVVKIPLTREGIKTVSMLAREGIRTNVTLCFSAAQALLAAKAGAYMVSPFVGRVDDLGYSGIDFLREVASIYSACGYKTQILAASIRGPRQVIEAAKAGAHIVTLPLKVLDQLFEHPLTAKGLDQFLSDYNAVFEPVTL